MNISDLTITKAHEGLKNREFSSKELTLTYLENIKNKDNQINSYLAITEELALDQAERADQAINNAEKEKKDFPLLMGIPCSINDSIVVKDYPSTSASKILENYISPYDATVIKKLKEQGSVMLGKTNLDEFAMGVSTENSAFKTTKNPHDLTRVPGGSSGGSAASVAAEEAMYSLGSDTGGSIRLPASFSGVVGLNPTYGAVSRYGLIALASSLDQIGPITKTVEDCKIVFEAICGKDPMDATSVATEIQNAKFKIQNLRIGVPKEYFSEGIDPEVENIIKNAIKKAKDAGAKIIPVSLPNTKYAIACYYIIVPSEASANLARY